MARVMRVRVSPTAPGTGVSPSPVKAADSESAIRRFESYYPCHAPPSEADERSNQLMVPAFFHVCSFCIPLLTAGCPALVLPSSRGGLGAARRFFTALSSCASIPSLPAAPKAILRRYPFFLVVFSLVPFRPLLVSFLVHFLTAFVERFFISPGRV